MTNLITCKNGCEKNLAREIRLYKGTVAMIGRGWILAQHSEPTPCFAYSLLENPQKISAASVNDFTEQLLNVFTSHLTDKRITQPWPLIFSSGGDEKLLHRAKTVEKSWREKLQRKMSRVAKLSTSNLLPSEQFVDGFFVYFIDFDQAFVSFKARSAGQKRMQMDENAPSRSYLKLEEAFHIFGFEPRKNETVVDLGAAPGGWSYSALKRGAIVTAVDNGPLKGVVRSHPNLTHLRTDAFKYQPQRNESVDWLLGDLLAHPDFALDMVCTWLKNKWCRRFVINLKVGRWDPIDVLKKIHDGDKGLTRHCRISKIRQLYHDREEITLMGQTHFSPTK